MSFLLACPKTNQRLPYGMGKNIIFTNCLNIHNKWSLEVSFHLFSSNFDIDPFATNFWYQIYSPPWQSLNLLRKTLLPHSPNLPKFTLASNNNKATTEVYWLTCYSHNTILLVFWPIRTYQKNHTLAFS